MKSLPTPRSGLRHHRLDDQVLVYDAAKDRTHLLDRTTGCVLDLLAEGIGSMEAMTAELSKRTKIVPNELMVALAIDDLAKADLLELRATVSLDHIGRRELLRRAGLVGASALILPAIVTLTPRVAAAGTCGTKSDGTTCARSCECNSGCCKKSDSKCGAGGGNACF